MQKTPGIITQRLKTQHPGLLPEVVTDLQVLRGEKLRERVAQRQVYLEEVLNEGSIAEDPETLDSLLSSSAQKEFLEEHLQPHEIIAVLLSTDPESPFLDTYLVATENIPLDDPYLAETMVSGAYLDNLEGYSPPYLACNDLMAALLLLQEKADQQKPKSDERLLTQYRLSRGCELFAEQITKTRQKDKQQKATEMLTKAHYFLTQSGFIRGVADIELLLALARSYRNSGDLIAARGAYLQATDQSSHLLSELEDTDPTNGSNDSVYNNWKIQRAQHLHDDAFGCLVSSDLFYIQTLLEELQQNSVENETAVLRAITEELDDAYERLKERGRITAGTPSAYESANLRRFTYGRYMMLVNEPMRAKKELDLVNKDTSPYVIRQATQILLEGYHVSFIDTPREKKGKRVLMYPTPQKQ